MKPLFFLILLSASPIFAQASAQNVSEVTDLLPSQRAFLNLSEKDRKEFAKHFGEAARYFQQKRIFESLASIHEAEKVFDQSAELLNLQGSCYVEMRAFKKATIAFDGALKINPKNTSIQFNVAEVLFVTKQWQKALDAFSEILPEIPETNIALSRLVEFKMLLCMKKLGMKDDVLILADKYDYQDDSPYYYYAKAALAYDDGDLLQAEEWLARASRIFQDPNIIAPWQDTLVEFGYIKSFYGEETSSAE